MKDREKAFIGALKQSGATFKIGDDGVEIDDYVLASDAFFEDVHFKFAWGDLEDIIEKCFLVNLSDVYAMHAVPHFCLLTLALPRKFKEVGKIAKIIGDCALKYEIKIIGGDTIVADKLHFSLTILGKRQGGILTRKGIKRGDILGYIAPRSVLVFVKQQGFGKNLYHLQNALRFHKNTKIPKMTRFAKPLLYPKMLLELNPIARAGMDISDGIFMELVRLSHLNRLGFKLFRAKGDWLYSPEEYQMLYAVPKNKLKKMQNIALKYRHCFIPFARAVRGRYKENRKNWHC